jgi:plasmid stabilization system protein ParE
MSPLARVPLSPDTPLEVEEIWLAMLRERGPSSAARRLGELSDACRRAARIAVRRAHPELPPSAQEEILLRETYGDAELARQVVARKRLLGLYPDEP